MGGSKDRDSSRSRSKDKKKTSKKKHKKDTKAKRSPSSSSSSSSSRSRSPIERKKSDKRTERRSRSNSRSRSRSGSSSKRRAEQKKRFADVPKSIRNPKGRVDEGGKKRFSVNNFALAGLLLDTKKTNERLDKEEVERANVKFKKIDHSERKATLLSSALSSKDEWANKDEYYMEYRNGEYIKVQKPYVCGMPDCGMRFAFSYELNDHIAGHNRVENELNQKRALQFVRKFDI